LILIRVIIYDPHRGHSRSNADFQLTGVFRQDVNLGQTSQRP